jgi:hypothetical protein
MRDGEVMKIFGQGTSYRNKDQLYYQLTANKLPQKTNETVYLELRIIFKNKKVDSYSVSNIYWH